MRLRILILAVLFCGLFAATAQAGDGRFPVTGVPAFTFHIPDDWTQELDDDGSLILISGNKTSSFVLTIGHYPPGTLDDIAAGVMRTGGAAPPQKMGPTGISGHQGSMYDSTMTNEGGVLVHVHLTVVKTAPNIVTTVTMLTMDGIGAADMQTAQEVLFTVRLETAP